MSIIDDKLDRGLDLLADAHADTDLLGVALLAFQGALIDTLRELLSTNPALSEADRAFVADPESSVDQLVDLAQRSADLTREQAWRILDAEKLRRSFSAGEDFRGSPREVRAYGRFVAELSGRTDLSRELAQLAPGEPAAKGAAPAARSPGLSIVRVLPGLVLLALILVGAWWLFNRAARIDEQALASEPTTTRSQGGLQPSIVAPPTVVASPGVAPATVAPEPTSELPAGARQARIVRLGGGPGWLHDTPSFGSPTLPIRLSEGQEVVALGQQQSDADGVPWVYVSVGGYEGWSPLNNVEYLSP
jgi:hypothetical protein